MGLIGRDQGQERPLFSILQNHFRCQFSIAQLITFLEELMLLVIEYLCGYPDEILAQLNGLQPFPTEPYLIVRVHVCAHDQW